MLAQVAVAVDKLQADVLCAPVLASGSGVYLHWCCQFRKLRTFGNVVCFPELSFQSVLVICEGFAEQFVLLFGETHMALLP